nr:phosphoribosylformylglycinamidine synthase subunit PurS [Tropheryma whipplei]
MVKIIIDVMPKPGLLDPQGRAIASALTERGWDNSTRIRVGKRFELCVDPVSETCELDFIRDLANDLLINPVIEDVVDIRIEDD